jgi:3,4-dihydroxy 2-butanone 4-phosphate synthase/GTP cyclohydrolase II
MSFDQARVVDAIRAIENGEIVVVTDDNDRENEGDLIMAAVHCKPEHLLCVIRQVLCVRQCQNLKPNA